MTTKDERIREIAATLTCHYPHASTCAEVAIRAALADPVLVPQWMPIESAPRDGTLIWSAQINTPEHGEIFWDKELLRWSSLAEDCDEPNWQPTHWQHLPQPPKEPTDGR